MFQRFERDVFRYSLDASKKKILTEIEERGVGPEKTKSHVQRSPFTGGTSWFESKIRTSLSGLTFS